MAWPVAVQAFDESILRVAHGAPSFAVPLFFVATVIGAGWGLLALVPFAVQKKTRPATLWLFAAIVTTSAMVSLLKLLFGRIRPCDALAWCPPIEVMSPGGGSFPSGHAAGSFAFAAFVAVRAPGWAAPAIAYAAMVAWSRCVLGVHYPSDIAAGALLGAVIGIAFARASLRRAPPGAPESRPTSATA